MSDNGQVSDSPSMGMPGCPGCVRLQRRLDELEQRLVDLEERLQRNAANSSTPPSANPPWARPPVKKKPTGKRPGGQPGHAGHHRPLLSPDQVDQVVAHVPRVCRRCQAPLADDAQRRVVGRHQVMELPARPVTVTEHHACACRCTACGEWTRESIPPTVTRYTTGPRLSAVVGFVTARVHGSRRAARELLEQVLGEAVAAGELSDEIDVPLTASALFGMVLVAALDWQAFQPERSIEEVHAALSRLLQGRVSGVAARP